MAAVDRARRVTLARIGTNLILLCAPIVAVADPLPSEPTPPPSPGDPPTESPATSNESVEPTVPAIMRDATSPLPCPAPPRPNLLDSHRVLAVHAGLGIGDFYGDSYQFHGVGPAIDVEAGAGNYLVSVLGYIDVLDLQQSGAQMPSVVELSLGMRAQLNLWRAFVGVGGGVGLTYPSSRISNNGGAMLELDLHLGYRFPKLGPVAPEALVIFTAGTALFPQSEDFPAIVGSPQLSSTRFALGGVF